MDCSELSWYCWNYNIKEKLKDLIDDLKIINTNLFIIDIGIIAVTISTS